MIEDLVKKFGTITAVNGLNMDVYKGEIYALLGPNGAGKTTTVRMIMGLLKPTSGKIFVDNIDVIKHPNIVKSRVGYMPQFFSLYSDLTVFENLDFYGRIYGLPREYRIRRIKELMSIVEISEYKDVLAGNLSGGLKRRLGLAATLIHDPNLIILDEPTAGVDPPLRRAFWRLFLRLRDEGKTILVTTHYMDEAENADRIGLISQGKLRAVGTPREIKRMVYGGDLMRLIVKVKENGVDVDKNNIKLLKVNNNDNRNEVIDILKVNSLSDSRIELILLVKDFGSALPTVSSSLIKYGAELLLAEPVPITLEDAFIALTTGEKPCLRN